MPRLSKVPAQTKSKSNMSPPRSVKFNIRPEENMSGPPADTKNAAPGKRGPLPSKSSPASTRRSPLKRSPSSQSRKAKQSLGRAESLSPTRSAASGMKAPRAQLGKGNSKHKEPFTTDDKNTKKLDFTKSGLKILDYSGEGMTSIPSSFITAKDIGHLILSSNNLRSLPPDIGRMTLLEKLDLSKNSIRCTNSNDFLGLPREMALLINLTELRIAECNLPFIPPAIFTMVGLKIVDLSRNKINILVPDIGQLVNLVQLNLQQTNITTLPPEIAYCQELEEIYLWGNSIETLPETLSEMPKLRLLALNYRSFCSVVDPYMENLLKKGQIKSEHIPVVVFEIPALESLDLESTKINTLPDIYTKKLKELYLCKNFLQTIPAGIYGLRHLHVLDMSNNLLTKLPEDIGELKGLKILRLAANDFELIPKATGNLTNLEELNMSHNRICSLPPEIKGLTALQVLNLAGNKIRNLPDEICELTQLRTLDLTNNEIHSLPMAMHQLTKLTQAHSFHKLEKCGLWLYKNPLVNPPPEVWRCENPDNIFAYLKRMTTFKIENLQRQKIQIIGACQSGKTTLVKALTQRKSLTTECPEGKTRLLEQTTWKTDNNVEFVLNDFGGDGAYRMHHKMFLDSKALVLLVYNAATLNEENFYSSIGQWLDMLSATIPGAIVKIVGTQVDLTHPNTDAQEVKTVVSNDESSSTGSENFNGTMTNEDSMSDRDLHKPVTASTLETIKNSHEETIHDLVSRFMSSKEARIRDEWESLQSDITRVKKSGQLELSEEATLKMKRVMQQKLKNILQNPLKILPQVSLVSASDSFHGILELTSELEHLAINKKLFPHAQKYVPGHWKRLRATLKQKAGYFLHWDDIKQAAELFSINDDELRECIKHLQDTADLLWFSDDPGLCEIVFHRPRQLVDIITSLYRHDMTDFMTYDNKLFFSKGHMSKLQFQECMDAFFHRGEISRPLLNCLWFHLGFKNDDISQLLDLLPLLEICYSVPESDVPSSPIHKRPLIILPWYNNDTDLMFLHEVWPVQKTDKELAVVYTFPSFCPPEFFPNLSARLQDFVDERMDWKDYIYASCGSKKLLLARSTEEESVTFTILTRGTEFPELQIFMGEIVDLINSQIMKYHGLYWKITIPKGLQLPEKFY